MLSHVSLPMRAEEKPGFGGGGSRYPILQPVPLRSQLAARRCRHYDTTRAPAAVLPRKDAKASNGRTESPKEMNKIDNTPKIHANLSRKENRG